MRWFESQRTAWIHEAVHIYGFINRSHLIRKFGISTAIASRDLQNFQRRYPGVVRYDASGKRYVAVASP